MGSRAYSSPLFNAAGGLAYHLRAARNYGGLWRPFREQLADWLQAWQPTEPHLALVGPSAGYNLPLIQLRRYKRVTLFEPDRLACWLFERRLRRALGPDAPNTRFVHSDHLVEYADRLLAFLQREQAAVLFCNVLGQLVHLVSEADREDRLAQVRSEVSQIITARSWASFHDRVSGPLAPKSAAVMVDKRWTDDELTKHAYDTSTQSASVELTDHHTEGYFPTHLPHAYLAWQIEPGRHHLIEAVQCTR